MVASNQKPILLWILLHLQSTFPFTIPKLKYHTYIIHNIPTPNHHRTYNKKLYSNKNSLNEIKEILLLSNPYEILNIPKSATKKDIKRAYRRMAMKYHPDVISSDVDKKLANDVFIKINGAYEDLLNGGGGGGSASKSSSSKSSGYEYTPPHRRKSTYTSNFDWDDYMKNYQKEETNNAQGDSFSAIFSDLIQEVVVGASTKGSKGILNDFVEFLEKSVDGFSTGNYDSDPTLEELLSTASITELKNELDDTELIVKQLQTKLNDISVQIQQLEMKSTSSTSFRTMLEVEEERAELEARKKVMMDYIQKGQNRLVKLQLRYKELRNSSTGYDSSSSYTSSYASTQQQSPNNESTTTTRNDKTTSANDTTSSSSSGTDSWKRQGFGSSGRGRGRSSRGRSASSSNTTSYNPNPTTQPNQQYTTKSPSQSASSTSPQQTTSSSLSNNSIPPHRRTTTSTSYAKQVMEDKKRLRELQIEEEFEKLKKEINKK